MEGIMDDRKDAGRAEGQPSLSSLSRILRCMVALFTVLAATAFAQQPTRLPSSSLSYPPVSFAAIQVFTPTGILLVQLDPSIQLDTSGPVPVLRAVMGAGTGTGQIIFREGPAPTVFPNAGEQGLWFNIADHFAYSINSAGVSQRLSPAVPTPSRTEVFVPAAAYTSVTLALLPDGIREVQVWRNGLLMAPTIDYTRAAKVITFTVLQGTDPADIVQVSYGPV